MAVLGQLIFPPPATADKYLSIGKEEIVRPLTIGNNWNSIKIGIHFAVDSYSGGNIGQPYLRVGLCSGQAQPFSSPQCRNFIGAALWSISNDRWDYQSNANPYYSGGAVGSVVKVAGALTEVHYAGSTYYFPTVGGATMRRGIGGVYLTKGSPNFTIVPMGTASYPTTDLSTMFFMDIMEQPSAFQLPSTSVAFSEANGILDTVSVSWNRADMPLFIYGLSVARIS